MLHEHELILTLSCSRSAGIADAVPGRLVQAGCHIIDSVVLR